MALSYTLAYVGCAVIFARFSDVIGRRDSFAIAFIIFLVSSLACGFAQTLNQLIALRALQGIGGSGLYSIAFVIMPEVTPEKNQKWIASLGGGVVTLAGILGPILGGVITDFASWRVSLLRIAQVYSNPQFLRLVSSHGYVDLNLVDILD